jgi:hypothetical protein
LAGGVEFERPAGEQGRAPAQVAPQEGAHPRHQFAKVKRLDQIIIGADVQPGNPIVGAAAGG